MALEGTAKNELLSHVGSVVVVDVSLNAAGLFFFFFLLFYI